MTRDSFAFLFSPSSFMVYSLFVEIGRVVLLNYGPHVGTLAVIIDILDQNRVLVSNPDSFPRQQLNLKRVTLTNLKVNVTRNVLEKELAVAYKEAKVDETFAETKVAKKMKSAQEKANLNDFERFKVNLARKEVWGLKNR